MSLRIRYIKELLSKLDQNDPTIIELKEHINKLSSVRIQWCMCNDKEGGNGVPPHFEGDDEDLYKKYNVPSPSESYCGVR